MGIGAAIAAIAATVVSSSMNAQAQRKSAKAQARAQQQAAEAQERANVQNEMANNRANAQRVDSSQALAQQQQQYRNYSQLTGGTGISSDSLQLGRQTQLARAVNVGLQTANALGSTVRLNDDII